MGGRGKLAVIHNGGTNNQLGSVLKSMMENRSLSMRKLSGQIGMNTATISRIMSGKQTPKMEHLQKFSDFFDIPVSQLLEASGVKLEYAEVGNDLDSFAGIIQETLDFSGVIDQKQLIPRVKKELERYERYACTEEGQQIIHERFQIKTQHVDGMGPFIEHLTQMYEKISREDISDAERAVLGSVLLYFILTTDIIPDYIFPIGYLDDAIAIKLGLERLAELEAQPKHQKGC
ncbi:DUF1232 domain-containing protein [Paenibacillaceae bacterium]|nr:DUF1232 domain-containing protein [Paenibacillaceae bacterium]